MKRQIFLCLSILLLWSCKSMVETRMEKTAYSMNIRVKILSAEKIMIGAARELEVRDFISGQELSLVKNGKITVEYRDGGCFYNGKQFTAPLLCSAPQGAPISIDQKNYYGDIRIYPEAAGFSVINTVPLESYLVSVVPSEVPAYFNLEALKAQAVVARTYSYYFIKKINNERGYDVDNTTSYQVYNGYTDIAASKNFKRVFQAVHATEGEIVTYDGTPIIAYFHSNSGGYITSGYNYFGSHSDLPYLVDRDDPYSIDYPGYKWELRTTKEEFLAKTDVDLHLPYECVLNEHDVLDEIKTGESSITPKTIRKKYGYKEIKSEKFTLREEGDEVLVITGYGYGHGVGMSQWGAEGMAEKGFTYKEIIKFYYPGTEITEY